MKIVYMGTPDFAVPPLKRLIKEGYNLPLVVSQPDRARGRGKRVQATAVKGHAEMEGIPICQPQGKDDFCDLIGKLKEIEPDLIVVAAYGKILPKELLDIPSLACVNIHASLLPRHRGAAPIQHAILSGDELTGVTLMCIAEAMDQGDIIATRATAIDKKTAGDLFEELANMGADLLIDTLPTIEKAIAERRAQDESKATYAPKIRKEDSLINFDREAIYIERQVRAMGPRPGAYTLLADKVMKIFSAEILDDDTDRKAGEIYNVDSKGISVGTGAGNILIKRIQMPGKQILDVSEFIKGNKIEIASILG